MLFKFLLDDVARRSPRPRVSDGFVELTDVNPTGLIRGLNRHQQDVASALSRAKSAPRSNRAIRYPFSPPKDKRFEFSMEAYPATYDIPPAAGSLQANRLSL